MGSACAADADDIMPLRGKGPRQQAGAIPSRAGAASAAENLDAVPLLKVKERHMLGSQDLVDAALAGDARRVGWALQAHADPNAAMQPTGLRALHICAAQGHTASAQALLQKKADLAAADNALGLTALSMACLGGHREAVHLLLCAGAPVDGPEGDGSSPLLRAAERNLTEIVEVLVSSGADVIFSRRTSAEPDRVKEAVARRNVGADWRLVLRGSGHKLLEPLRVQGVTALHLSAAHGNVRACSALLTAGARPNALDALLRSPLMLAGERGHVGVTSLLLERRSAVGANAEGHTVATLAVRGGHIAVMQLLLEHGACEVDASPWAGGPTMLHVASHYGWGGCVALLCERDANVDVPLEPGGVFPLMLAAAKGSSDICRELLAYGAGINRTDAEGKTAWLHAAAAGRAEVCQLLTGYGARELVSGGDTVGGAQAAGVAAGLGRRRRRIGRQEEDVRPAVHSSVLLQHHLGEAAGAAGDRAAGF